MHELVRLLSGHVSRLVQKHPVQASVPWHTRWHTEQGTKQKSPSESITWAYMLAETESAGNKIQRCATMTINAT